MSGKTIVVMSSKQEKGYAKIYRSNKRIDLYVYESENIILNVACKAVSQLGDRECMQDLIGHSNTE